MEFIKEYAFLMERVTSSNSDESMGLFELNKKLTIAREGGFKFNQINKFSEKIYSNLSHINIHCYLKLRIPIKHRQLFRKLAQSHDYNQTFCNDRRNPFNFACRQWY